MTGVKEALQLCLQQGLTFAAFRSGTRINLWVARKPGLKQIRWSDLGGQKDVFLIAPFLADRTYCTFLATDLQWDITNGADLEELQQAEGSPLMGPEASAHWDKAGHATAIREIQKAMAQGTLEKAVLSRTKELPLVRDHIPDLFLLALKEQPEAFVCLVNCPEYGTWLGASPEMLVHAQGTQVRVDSIAGTLPLAAAPEDPQQWGAKEREEQEMVTTSVLNTFQELGLEHINMTGPSLLKAAHVAHLHTMLKAELGGTSLWELVQALHPTPAVCGTPRERALQVIRDHEPHHRSLYAGFWGIWQQEDTTRLYVNIRCMRLFHDRAWVYVGGGITAGSDPAREWVETEHKALTWQRHLEALARQ